MVKVIVARSKSDGCKVGMHLYKPTKQKIQEFKEEARNKGFKYIYIHKSIKTLCG